MGEFSLICLQGLDLLLGHYPHLETEEECAPNSVLGLEADLSIELLDDL